MPHYLNALPPPSSSSLQFQPAGLITFLDLFDLFTSSCAVHGLGLSFTTHSFFSENRLSHTLFFARLHSL